MNDDLMHNIWLTVTGVLIIVAGAFFVLAIIGSVNLVIDKNARGLVCDSLGDGYRVAETMVFQGEKLVSCCRQTGYEMFIETGRFRVTELCEQVKYGVEE